MRLGDRDSGTDLWFMDGVRYGRVDVRLTADGGLEIRRRDLGASDRAAWGEDDHEATLKVSGPAAVHLALVLLQDRFAGRADALEAIEAFCEGRDIPTRHAVWT